MDGQSLIPLESINAVEVFTGRQDRAHQHRLLMDVELTEGEMYASEQSLSEPITDYAARHGE